MSETSGLFTPTQVYRRVGSGTWPNDEDFAPGMGMALMTPTSIAYSGTSATIGANGSVEFSACSSLSLNGVFTADYDNYLISYRSVNTTYDTLGTMRLRSSGTNDDTSSYAIQVLDTDNTTITASRGTNVNKWEVDVTSTTQRSGTNINIYGPFLTQPTAMRSCFAGGYLNATLRDYAGTHSLSASYDGVTIYSDLLGSFTGLISVYGLVGA